MTSVSVVIPTRNRSALLAITLRSVLRQRGVELEVIVVDEGSTDDTAAVIAGFADPRVAVVKNAVPIGLSAARNKGAAQARGEWLGFVDDDDLWAPDKLSRQVAAAEESRRDWVYTGAVAIGDGFEIVSGRPPGPPDEVVAQLQRYNSIPGGGSNVLLRRALLARAGGFDERLPPCADWELWIRLARLGLPAVVPYPLVGYRVHGGNSSLDREGMRRAVLMIEQIHGTTVDWGSMHRWWAESCLRNGLHAAALGEFARAAVRGQAAGVAADIAAILKRYLGRYGGERLLSTDARGPDAAWHADASVWLRELERCA